MGLNEEESENAVKYPQIKAVDIVTRINKAEGSGKLEARIITHYSVNCWPDFPKKFPFEMDFE